MALIDILVPQMGEGLQEVIVVGFHKQPGEAVKRDEILYSMETDKAVLEVESPYEGVLKEWLAEEGAILPIGAPIARLEATVAEPAAMESAATSAPAAETVAGRERSDVQIPPRTRAYCRQMNLSEDEMRQIPAPTGKLMPADVDAYLAKKANGGVVEEVIAEPEAPPAYVERALSAQHRTFIYRLKRSVQVVVPGTAKRSLEWGGIRRYAENIRAQGGDLQPSTFQTFAYCVAQAVKEHPRFRSALIGEHTVREYAHLNLGIAVGRANGDLVTAMVPDADTLDYEAFVRTAQAHIQSAREGEDQATETTQLLLTYMGPYEITDAVPVLVAPAVAVLFIGAAFDHNGEPTVNLALTFDHRLIQGIEAAEFLRTVVARARQVEQTIAAGGAS